MIESFDEIQRWAELPTRKVAHPSGLPIEIHEPLSPITIDAVTVETFGVDYRAPHIAPCGLYRRAGPAGSSSLAIRRTERICNQLFSPA